VLARAAEIFRVPIIALIPENANRTGSQWLMAVIHSMFRRQTHAGVLDGEVEELQLLRHHWESCRGS
jgi:hypothetical protein